MILKSLVLGPYGTNCYIVGAEAGGDGMVIDPGDEPKRIIQAIKDSKLNIKIIVITHGHGDHIGALEEIKKVTGAKTAIHEADANDLDKPADILLKGGESLTAGNLRFLVIHTPGHSPGGICLYGHGILFSGDTLFNFSVGRTDLGGSMSQLLNGIFTKLLVLPDSTKVYPGHGPATNIGDEKHSNPFLRFR